MPKANPSHLGMCQAHVLHLQCVERQWDDERPTEAERRKTCSKDRQTMQHGGNAKSNEKCAAGRRNYADLKSRSCEKYAPRTGINQKGKTEKEKTNKQRTKKKNRNRRGIVRTCAHRDSATSNSIFSSHSHSHLVPFVHFHAYFISFQLWFFLVDFASFVFCSLFFRPVHFCSFSHSINAPRENETIQIEWSIINLVKCRCSLRCCAGCTMLETKCMRTHIIFEVQAWSTQSSVRSHVSLA